jgi:enoyl-CoA hydratase/carnithine racemase
MTYSHLTITSNEDIATITLQRPECGNALSLKLMSEIIDACNSFKYDTKTRVIIFCGDGKHFCVGVDLKDPERVTRADGATLLDRSRLGQIGKQYWASIKSR